MRPHRLPWQGMPCHAVSGQTVGTRLPMPHCYSADQLQSLPLRQLPLFVSAARANGRTENDALPTFPPSSPRTCDLQIPFVRSRIAIATLLQLPSTDSAMHESNIFSRISFFLVSYFGSIQLFCELGCYLVLSSQKSSLTSSQVYFILDEFLLPGELQQARKCYLVLNHA